MTQPSMAPTPLCDCAALGPLDPVLREHGAASGRLVALTDEGMLCVIDSWPHDCSDQTCLGHVWTDAEWSFFLQGFAAYGPLHHVSTEGHAVIPVVDEGLLWGAVVVDPGDGCPNAIAAAVQPHVDGLVDAVRTQAE